MRASFGLLVAAGLLTGGLGVTHAPTAEGAIPADEPSFSDPLAIDNLYYPVAPGTIHVYLGRDGGRRITVVVSHLLETRDFLYEDGIVTCRVVQEHKFESGQLIAEQESYFAQANDGSVWVFGETEDDDDDDDDDEDDDDDDDDEPSGWVVGALTAADPIDTVSVNGPSLVMPTRPDVGDAWFSENAGPMQTQHVEVRSVKAKARIRGARFSQSIRIKETTPGERGGEVKWYAPGVGFVGERGDGVRLRLNASTIGLRRR